MHENVETELKPVSVSLNRMRPKFNGALWQHTVAEQNVPM